MGVDTTVKLHGSTLGQCVQIREFCTIHDSVIESYCKIYERVSVKKSRLCSGCDINAGTYIENAFLHENVQVAMNCSIAGVTHKFSSAGVNHDDHFSLITIEEDVWIGAGAIILPGVIIGKGAVIGAGSIVINGIPPHFRYVGTPLNNRLETIK